MRLSRVVGSNLAALALSAGVMFGLAHCSSSSSPNGTGSSGTSAQGSSGSSNNAGPGGGGASSGDLGGNGGGTGAGGTSSGGGPGASGSTGTGSSTGTGATTGSGGSTGSASTGSASGGADGGAPPVQTGADGGVVLSACVSADTKPCSSFAYPLEDGGTQAIQLGPYGAQADVNVGKGFANTVQSSDTNPQPSSACQSFANLFGEPQGITDLLLKTSMNGITIDFSLYSAYRPSNWPEGPIPVITWGNGTCAQPEGYGALLRYVASYGFFVIAANSRQVGTNNSDGTQPMLHALDYAAAANKDPSSPYYGHLDMTKVGAMGHSQGGAATVTAAMDARVKDVIIFNGGLTASKEFIAISGDQDILNTSASAMSQSVMSATTPASYFYYHNPIGMGSLRGHLVLMLSPGRVTDQATSWWQMVFNGDATAKAKFVGSSCGFCGKSSDPTNAYDFGEKGL